MSELETDTNTDTPVGRDSGSGGGGGGINPIVIGVIAVAVVLVGLVVLLATGGDDKEADSSGQVLGEAAPELAGATVAGGEIDLADMRDDWVLVNFFATWCAPCVEEHPELAALSDNAPEGLKVVSVAYNEPDDAITEFFATHGGDWPVVTQSRDIPIEWGVIGLPESFLVAPGGEVVEKYKGGITANEIEQAIAEHS